jgi:hypothetical protein
MLTNAPSETLILRPDPALRKAEQAEPSETLAVPVHRIRPAAEARSAVRATTSALGGAASVRRPA